VYLHKDFSRKNANSAHDFLVVAGHKDGVDICLWILEIMSHKVVTTCLRKDASDVVKPLLQLWLRQTAECDIRWRHLHDKIRFSVADATQNDRWSIGTRKSTAPVPNRDLRDFPHGILSCLGPKSTLWDRTLKENVFRQCTLEKLRDFGVRFWTESVSNTTVINSRKQI
jgi:hypothetical protein